MLFELYGGTALGVPCAGACVWEVGGREEKRRAGKGDNADSSPCRHAPSPTTSTVTCDVRALIQVAALCSRARNFGKWFGPPKG